MRSSRWLEMLVEFFDARSEALGEVLDAASCREGWLQGELFRWFRCRQGIETFAVNSLCISDSEKAKADFSADEPTQVVGEIKLLGVGDGYFTKVITGGSIKPFLNRIDQPITATDRDLVLGPWGLIPDFFRLLDYAGREDREAFLVLVLDERSHNERSLAQALRGINFIGPSRNIRFPVGVVRIWSAPATSAVVGSGRTIRYA